MSILTTPKRIARNTIQHVARNPWHSLAAVAMVTLTFLVIQVFMLVALGSNQVIEYFENKPQVTAFFKDQASEAYILQTKSQLEKTGLVKAVIYVSKTDALEIYRQQNINEPQLLEFVTADILPASLEIATYAVDDLPEIAQHLQQDALVEKVIFQQDVIEALTSFTQRLRWIGLGLVAILALVTVLIVLVVISANLASFGREIEVMRLVGAGSWFIRWPFLLDGVSFGVVAASLSSAAIWLLLPYIKQFTASFINGIEVFPVAEALVLQLWLGAMGAAALLGLTASFAATWRRLKI